MASEPFGGQSAFPAPAIERRRRPARRSNGRRLVTLALVLATGTAGWDSGAQAQQPRGVVQQTSGGLFGGLFGNSDKPKDDGRRAYALPPPDPASVNWAGVPYHTPPAGQAVRGADAAPVPLRDVTSARGTISDTAAATPKPTVPAAAQPRTVPAAPAEIETPRVAAAPTLSGPRVQPSADSEPSLSTDSSSRRANRRAVAPLSLGPDLTANAETSPTEEIYQAVEDVPSVPRRQLDQSSPTSTIGSGLATGSELTTDRELTVDDELIPPVNRTAPGQPATEAKAYPEESIAGQLTPLRPAEMAETADAAETAPPSEPLAAEQLAQQPALAAAPSEWEATPSSDAFTAHAASQPLAAATSPAGSSGSIAAPHAAPTSQPPGTAAAASKLAVGQSELPGIRVVTQGPATIHLNEPTQYEVRIENRGTAPTADVIVRTNLPEWAEVVDQDASAGTAKPSADTAGQWEWRIERLPGGQTERLLIRVKPLQSGSFDVTTAWSVSAQSHNLQATVLQPQLAIEIEGPETITFGETQKYRVRVLNPGDGVASNIVFTLAPDAEDSVQQPIGDIPAGKEASFEVELTARDLGELKILGAAAGDRHLAAEAHKTVAVLTAELESTLTGPPLRYRDTEAAYQLQLTNRGAATARSVEASVELPAGVEYLGGIDGARVTGDRLVWQIDSITADQTLDYEFRCRMNQTGNHQLRFSAHGTAAAQTSVELATAVEAIADLKLAVVDPQAPAPVGGEVIYEVQVNNRGSKAAQDVRVVAQFGHGIEPVRIQGHDGEVVTGQVLFEPIEQIKAGEKVVLKIVAKADKPGDHRFRAEVRSGETVLVAEEATVFAGQNNQRISRSSSDQLDR